VAHYLVIHTPTEGDGDTVRPPTQLVELAKLHGPAGAQPRWLKTWSPDLHDDRIFSFWEAANADDILNTIRHFGFLDNMEAKPIAVREWSPIDVLAAEPDS
jgi:hypothetical protein